MTIQTKTILKVGYDFVLAFIVYNYPGVSELKKISFTELSNEFLGLLLGVVLLIIRVAVGALEYRSKRRVEKEAQEDRSMDIEGKRLENELKQETLAKMRLESDRLQLEIQHSAADLKKKLVDAEAQEIMNFAIAEDALKEIIEERKTVHDLVQNYLKVKSKNNGRLS